MDRSPRGLDQTNLENIFNDDQTNLKKKDSTSVHNVYFVKYDVTVSFLAQVLDTLTYFVSQVLDTAS